MSKKQDAKQRQSAQKSASTRPKQQEKTDSLEGLADSQRLSAERARSLQDSTGNQALIDALTSSGASEEQFEAAESQTHQEKKKASPQVRPTRPARRSPGLSTSSSQGNSFWELLLGGDDDQGPPPPSQAKSPPHRRSRPWLPVNAPETPKAPHEISGHTHPHRPQRNKTGQRFSYAMDAWIGDASRWEQADVTPESLAALAPEHPLRRLERCALFWSANAKTPVGRATAQWILRDPKEIGHAARIARGVGLWALLEAVESQQTNPQRIADASALALQESAGWAIQQVARESESLLSTDNLFSEAALREKELPSEPTNPPSLNDDCPLMQAALQFSIPLTGLPPILWPHTASTDSLNSPDTEHLDALLNEANVFPKSSNAGTNELQESASSLLESCCERRLQYAAGALALWRTSGPSLFHAFRGLLKSADRRLRSSAIQIASDLDRLDTVNSIDQARPLRDSLLRERERLSQIDSDVLSALVRLCTPKVETKALEPLDTPYDQRPLANAIKNTNNVSSQPHETLACPALLLTQKWLHFEQGTPDDDLALACRHENNPWLWIRQALLTRSTREEQTDQEFLDHYRDDSVVASLWSACLSEQKASS